MNKRHLGCWLLAVSLGLGSFCWPLFYPAWAQVQPPTTTPASCLAQPLPAPQDSDLLGLNLPDTITLCPLDQTVGAAYPAIPIIFSGVVGAYPGKLRMNLEPSQVTTNPNFDPFYGENRAGFEATCLKNGEPVPHCPLRLEILVERNSGSHDDDRKIVARPRGAIQLMNPGSGVSGTTINATFTTVAGEIVPPGAGQAATYDTETGDSGSFQFYYAAPEAAGLTKLTVHYFVGQADAPRPLSAEITVKVADPFLGVRGYNGTNGGSWHITEPYANSDRCHFYENYYARWGTHDRLNSTAEYFALILGGAAGVPLAPWSL